jgi:integrase
MKIRLTNAAAEKAGEGIHWFERQRGDGALGLRVADSGMRTYFLKRRVNGKERNIKLGRHGEPVLLPDGSLRSFNFGAEDARAKAAALVGQMLQGIDPVVEKERKEVAAAAQVEQDKALSTTLQQVVDHYLEHHRVKGKRLRPKTRAEYRKTMERWFAEWLPKPCAPIDRAMCFDRFAQIEAKRPKQLHKCSTYLSLFLSHARKMHADPKTGVPTILAINPVALTREIKKTAPSEPRTRRIPAAKVGAAWSFLRQRATLAAKHSDRTAADWLSTILITGWRATESAALEWSWINMEEKTVKLPGDVEPENELGFAGVKTHIEATYPLSDVLFGILKERWEMPTRDDRHVFPAQHADADLPHLQSAHGTMRLLAEVTGCVKIVDGKKKYLLSPHDLRRSAEDAALACKIDYSLRQRLLAHKPQAVHDSAYSNDPSPEILREAVNAIAAYFVDAGKVYDGQQAGHNVISLADRRQA